MGNWNINIQGLGCHHNSTGSATDANNMAAKFVHDLIAAGHSIQVATFTHGGAEELRPAVVDGSGVRVAPPLQMDSRTSAIPK